MEDWNGFARLYSYQAETGIFEPRWRNAFRPGKDYAAGGAGCTSTVEDFIKFLEALRVGDVILKKETVALMSTNRLTEKQRATYTCKVPGSGYGLGMRTPLSDPRYTEFGWAGAAGSFASVDPINNISLFYAQHVLSSPNRPLRKWLYNTVLGDLAGKRVEVPIDRADDNPALTY